MRITTLAAAIAVCALSGAPALAGYGPMGTWTCSAGAAAGDLDMSAKGYSFAKAGSTDPADGSFVMDGATIELSGGPLKDMGLAKGWYVIDPGLGEYVPSGDWAGRLEFTGPGGGMSCVPRYHS